MNRYVTWPAYIHDLAIFDDRLTAVENKVEQIMKLLEDISKDLSNGGTEVATQVQASTRAPNRTSGRAIKRTEDVHLDY